MKTILIILALSLNSYAANTKNDASLAKACAIEIKKFCAKEKSDTDIYNCLEKHEKKISKNCDEANEYYGQANGLEKKDDK